MESDQQQITIPKTIKQEPGIKHVKTETALDSFETSTSNVKMELDIKKEIDPLDKSECENDDFKIVEQFDSENLEKSSIGKKNNKPKQTLVLMNELMETNNVDESLKNVEIQTSNLKKEIDPLAINACKNEDFKTVKHFDSENPEKACKVVPETVSFKLIMELPKEKLPTILDILKYYKFLCYDQTRIQNQR